MKTVKTFFFTLLLCGSSYAEGGFYTGIGLGTTTLSSTAQSNLVLDSGNASNATGNSLSGNLYFGYDINHYIGVQEEYDTAFNPTIGNSYNTNAQIFGTTVLLHLPFSMLSDSLAGLNAFAKGGIGYETFQTSGSSGGYPNCINPAPLDNNFVPMYGAGIEYGFTNVGYRLEWDGIGSMMNTNHGINQVALSSNMYLLSIMYHF